MHHLNKLKLFRRLSNTVPKSSFITLFCVLLATGLTEGIGLLLLLPLLALLDGNNPSNHDLVTQLKDVLSGFNVELNLVTLLILFVCLLSVRSFLVYLKSLQSQALQHQLIDSNRRICFEALLYAEWKWLSAKRTSDFASVLLTDINRLGVAFHFAINFGTSLITSVIYLGAAVVLSWQLTLLAFASGSLLLMLLAGQRKRALLLGSELGVANKNVHASVQESLGAIKLTKILGAERNQLTDLKTTIDHLRKKQLGFTASTAASNAMFQVLGAMLLAVFLFIGVVTWQIPVAEMLVMVLIFGRVLPMFLTTHQNIQHILHAIPAMEMIVSTLNQCDKVREPAHREDNTTIKIFDAIKLHDVTVQFDSREKPALKAVNVEFPKLTTTAIMGHSGAGKSTIADVLMGLLEPSEGQLTVDGQAITSKNRICWRRSVAYVPQDTFLFHDSIRNNLLLGSPTARDSDLLAALKQAAAEFVFELPEGINTVVGDGGTLLSGGERQRVALARALLAKPSLLILDEPTSALDQENELKIREAIENLQGNLIVIIIGHRLLPLRHADHIVYLEQGQIIRQQ